MADFWNVQPDEYKLLGCNYTPGRPWGIMGITEHHMAGDLDADDCNRVWRGAGTSAHYTVAKGGKIVQHVHDTDRAWACGDGVGICSGGNDRTISIEHANDKRGPWTIYPEALESGAHLTAALCLYYNLGRPEWDVNVFPHKRWSATNCPGELYGSQKEEYIQRAQAWYDAMINGGEPAPAPTPAQAPSASSGKHVHYALHVKGGGWWSEVTDNTGSGYDAFAGAGFTEHDMFYIWGDGINRYRVHTIEDGWLDWVYKADINDSVNGLAGVWGHTIDGFQIDGDVCYRAQTVAREGWLDTVRGTSDFAGWYGEASDKFQAWPA